VAARRTASVAVAAAALMVAGAGVAHGAFVSRVPPDGRVVARSAEGRRVVLEVREGRVVGVRAGLQRYRCETFGEIGPLVVNLRGRARVGRDGRFAFVAGVPAQTLRVAGRFSPHGRAVTGSVRVAGTIATGQRCSSRTVSFTGGAVAGGRAGTVR
jgi:hypothetical protein